jgi:hypothetical protein
MLKGKIMIKYKLQKEKENGKRFNIPGIPRGKMCQKSLKIFE